MQHLTNEQKAQMYNNLLNQYQRLQEQVRQIKAQDVNVSDANQKKINELELMMKKVYSQTEKLYR